jgi:glycosyltransferase involved in cell wall biosynthesis
MNPSFDINTPAPSAQLRKTKTRPPAVLQVLPSLVTGGVERGTVDIAKALVAAGWTALVASSGGPMVREIERAGARHFTLPLASKNPFVIYRNIGRLTALMQAAPVDIVHARSRAPAWSAYAAARQRRIPFVTTFHGVYNFSNALKRRYNAIMTRGDRVIANSHFIAAHIAENYGVAPDRVKVIPRGVDIKRFDSLGIAASRIIKLAGQWRLPDGLPVVMLPGRLARWKGQLVLLEAVAQMTARAGHPLFTTVLVGDDQGRKGYRDEIQARIENLGSHAVVRLVGHCEDMPAAYMLADVVVSASTDPEAFGRVAVEAQAMGRPTIATDHGGARETVIADRTGWLVAPNDAGALVEALDRALALDAGQRGEMARLARQHVADHFTVERMCESTLDLYTEILTAAGAS